MSDQEGQHDEQDLESGETVHLTKHPNEAKWAITSYDWGGISSSPQLQLETATVYAEKLKWESMRFDTPNQAYAFVADQIKTGKAPGKKTTSRRA
jgi:hypothetical protein